MASPFFMLHVIYRVFTISLLSAYLGYTLHYIPAHNVPLTILDTSYPRVSYVIIIIVVIIAWHGIVKHIY